MSDYDLGANDSVHDDPFSCCFFLLGAIGERAAELQVLGGLQLVIQRQSGMGVWEHEMAQTPSRAG